MTDAVMILERALNQARQVDVSPLQILAWQSDSRPETVKAPLPPGHGEALASVHKAAGGVNLWVWRKTNPSHGAVVKLFEDALFNAQMDAL